MKRKRAVHKSSPPAKRDTVDSLVAASAQALGLALDPAWEAGVSFNLQLILRHAAVVDQFPLPDEAEPAPIFHA
jgi:1-carboxybiuret hydrolase subunit AtzG-like